MELTTVETPVHPTYEKRKKRLIATLNSRITTLKEPKITHVTELPPKPFVGMTFGTYGTNSIGTVEKVIGANTVQYSYGFNPEQKFTEPYSEVKKFSFMA